jgi:hypothetical protein
MFTAVPKHVAADPWIKVVGMLQQNWAVIIERSDSVLVVFYNDLCAVFDEMQFDSVEEATTGLLRNGFTKYSDNPQFSEFIALPEGQFVEGSHPSGRIYSSGEYWT